MTVSSFIIIGAVAVLLIVFIVIYNGLVALRNKVNEAFATMDVYLKQRYDLIPSLVEVVKGYSAHEANVLISVAKERASATSVNNKVEGECKISSMIGQIMVVSEKYPSLLANKNFLELQEKLTRVEEDIAFARRYYNGSVREFNDKCLTFPSNLVAGMFGFKKMSMYEVGSTAERNAINVEI